MSDSTHSDDERHSVIDGINPLIALIIIITIAIIMVATTFTIFLRSNAYQTVQQIKAGTQVTSKNDLEGYDITSPIKANELDKLDSSLKSTLNSLDDENDFGQNGLSEKILGL